MPLRKYQGCGREALWLIARAFVLRLVFQYFQAFGPDFINHEALPKRIADPSRCKGWPVCCARPSLTCASRSRSWLPKGTPWCDRLTTSGTHQGPLIGIPLTGRSVRQDHMHVVRFLQGIAVDLGGERRHGHDATARRHPRTGTVGRS